MQPTCFGHGGTSVAIPAAQEHTWQRKSGVWDAPPVMYERLFAEHLTLPPRGAPLDRLALPAGGGVYAVTDEDGLLVQIIGAQSIRRSLWQRLAPQAAGASRKRADLRSVARVLWWQRTYSTFETSFVHLNIVRQLHPRDYQKQLGFGPAWFARLDLSARVPRWVVAKKAFGEGVMLAGPFVTRKHCARFVQLLEDLFDLCRRHDILERVPRGQRCAYFDMGRCPAPCDGTMEMKEYRAVLEASARLATTGKSEHAAALQARMARASAALDFDRAQQLKSGISRVGEALSEEGRFALSPETFCCLVIHAGAGVGRVRPFFVNRGRIEVGRDTDARTVDQAARRWADYDWSSDNAAQCDSTYRTECLALVNHYLAKGAQASGVYLSECAARDPQTIVERVRAKYLHLPP